MEYNLETIIAEAKKSKPNLVELKKLMVKLGCYDLAAQLRNLEKELYPETEEIKKIKEKSLKISGIFGMCGIEVSATTSYIINEAINVYNKKEGQFSIDDAVKIQIDAENIFLYSTLNE